MQISDIKDQLRGVKWDTVEIGTRIGRREEVAVLAVGRYVSQGLTNCIEGLSAEWEIIVFFVFF